jgi:hypothetical protein
MTISSQTNKSGPYNGNGVTTVFAYGFPISDQSHIEVIATDAAGAEVIKTLTTHYTVSGVGSPTGSITMLVAPASGTKITVIRNVPFTQLLDLQNQGAFFAEVVEAAFDAGVARDQQIKELVDRSVKLPASADSSTLDALVADIGTLSGQSAAIDTVAGISASVVTVAGMAAAVAAVPAAAVSTAADVVLTHADVVLADNARIAAEAAASGTTTVPVQINAAADTAFADADMLAARKNADGSLIKRSWLNVKSLLNAYFQGLGALTLAAGDLLYASGVGALARLAKATDGMVLTLVSGLPAWAAPALGGMTLVGTLTTTSGTTQSLTGIATTYKHLRAVLVGVSYAGASTNLTLQIKLSSNNGGVYGAAFAVGGGANTNATLFHADVNILMAGTNPSTKVLSGNTKDGSINGLSDAVTTGLINAIQFALSDGSAFDAGTIYIYGVN